MGVRNAGKAKHRQSGPVAEKPWDMAVRLSGLRPPASGEGRNGTGVLLPTGLSRRLVRRRAAVELYLQRCRPFIVPLHRAERRPDALQRMSRSTGICTKRACLWARSASFRRPGWWAPRQQQSLAVSRLALFPAASPSHPKQHREMQLPSTIYAPRTE